jgi:pimeloyl-ACP methyl ester carboxylesterase
MTLRPFEIQVPTAVLTDLKQRLAATRWPDEIPDSGWDYGTNLAYLKQLVAYWRDTFDWRAQERLLNSFPQFTVDVDGLRLHFIHVKGKGKRPIPLLISHGWPGSFFEMYKIIGPLADPASYSGDPEDAFDVIVPSLPGYGFSERPRERGVDVVRIAELLMRLMTEVLDYPRFAAQGGDWGSFISSRLGYAYPDKLIGIHLNAVFVSPGSEQHEMTEEERAWREQWRRYRTDGSGYNRIQSTRPQTLAYGLNDSPAGLAGWIVEKFREWSDCNGDVESVYTKEELLTTIMIYWVTETINSSARLYYEVSHHGGFFQGRVDVPTGVALFPKDIFIPPRAVAERSYNIQRWTKMSGGGHFAALERPKELVEEIRAFFRPLRS